MSLKAKYESMKLHRWHHGNNLNCVINGIWTRSILISLSNHTQTDGTVEVKYLLTFKETVFLWMMPRYSKHGSNSDICTKSSEQTCILNDDFEINYLISVHSFWRISVNMVIERNPFLRFWNYHSHLQRRKSTVLTLKRMSKYLSTGCLFQMHAFKMTLIHLQVIRTLFHLLL